ncbi:hypothetical protein KSP39_PZI019566 [Platanthera zijinensis]|uniref:Integrase catalytic domain-containing protein n=1 Tax=Platanthera zijinensis TaxID=2320716 RepID=A0AAP0B1S7_9ASPA
MTMEFIQGGKGYCLNGLKTSPMKEVTLCFLERSWDQEVPMAVIMELAPLPTSPQDVPEQMPSLLVQYFDIFQEPHSLPSQRFRDHQIILKEEAEPTNIWPYHYPHIQKAEIEQSVKDKFPIPMIEELLEELHGARLFMKLDLCSGYHQIRMKKEDIYKTAFRTHDDHYEFLVMPFGLSNASYTFQEVMNEIFRPHLRRSVSIFFEDILIYNASWQEHLQDVEQLLAILRQHQLYAKLSKCSFGQAMVEYLGHIVSEQGVHADSKKIESMQTRSEWRGCWANDYEIVYKQGKKNVVVDALSCIPEGTLHHFSGPLIGALDDIQAEILQDPDLCSIVESLQQELAITPGFHLQNGHLYYHDKVVIPTSSPWRITMLLEFHSSLIGGHAGVLHTLQRIRANVFWKGQQKDVQQFVRQCEICQRQKYKTTSPACLLTPLEILQQIWDTVFMDFIDDLPRSQGQTVILVLVDKMSKYDHSLALHHPYMGESVADLFVREIIQLHCISRTIISDRDSVFVGNFWRELFRLQGTRLCMSTAHHPQKDGQTKVCPTLPEATHSGELRTLPEEVLLTKWKKRGTEYHQEILVKWMNLSAAHNTQVDLLEFRELYPDFHLEDKLVADAGGNVMTPHNDRFTEELWAMRLGLRLLQERAASGSFWWPYISNLPETFSAPIFFSGADIKNIQYIPLVHQVNKRCSFLLEFEKEAKTLLETLNPKNHPFGGQDVNASSLGWAMTAVSSRAFCLHGEVLTDGKKTDIHMLLPLIDMCNHSFYPNAKIVQEQEKGCSKMLIKVSLF